MRIIGSLVCTIDQDTQIWDDEGLYGVEIDSDGNPVGVFTLNERNRSWVEPHLPESVEFPE